MPTQRSPVLGYPGGQFFGRNDEPAKIFGPVRRPAITLMNEPNQLGARVDV
jgi:hypothetical protein